MNGAGERHAYWVILFMLAMPFLLSPVLSAVPQLRYIVYGLPFPVLAVAMLSRRLHPHVSREVAPFALLLLLAVFSFTTYDFNTVKKVTFVAVYTSVFMMVDFRRVEIDLRMLSLLFTGLLIYQFVLVGRVTMEAQDLRYSFGDSKSPLESSMAFPIALLGAYFLTQKKYLIALLHLVVVVVALKRIAVLSLLVAACIWVTPMMVRRLVLHPLTIMVGLVLVMWASIEFTRGTFDALIFEYAERAPNDFSKGRQRLWTTALEVVNFKFADFVFYGAGLGKVVTGLLEAYDTPRILLHNDLLSLYLEVGLLGSVMFAALLAAQRSMANRLVAAVLCILFLSDNVLIYQHVMITYLLVQTQISRNNHLDHAPPVPIEAPRPLGNFVTVERKPPVSSPERAAAPRGRRLPSAEGVADNNARRFSLGIAAEAKSDG